MGNILNCGLTAVGTAKSALNDSGFKKDCDDLKMSAVTFGNKREQLHAEAVYAFAYGYSLYIFKKYCSLVIYAYNKLFCC